MMIGTALNSIIRADGSPKYAMTTMVTGAILNTILDPIFIFVFKMGVEGAAIATIFSQFITFVLNAWYIKKFKSIEIKKEAFRLEFSVVRKVSALGISSFITQMSFVVVMAFENNLLAKYGALSKFGAEIPITVLRNCYENKSNSKQHYHRNCCRFSTYFWLQLWSKKI